MMRLITVSGLLLLSFVGLSPALMQDNPPALVIPDTQSIALTSATNGQDYVLSIALPPGYDTSEQSYPVLYLLDPAISFLSVVEVVRWLSHWDELPQLIIVGIGYTTSEIDEIMAPRERDYYRSQDEFLTFISDELFPLIDSTYRTDSTDRALVGFSYGGELVFHTLLTQPDLFNRYIAIDSVMTKISKLVVDDDPAFRESFAGLDVRLFISSAGTESLTGAMKVREYEGLTATGLSLGNVTHGAALHLSLTPGIIAIYAE